MFGVFWRVVSLLKITFWLQTENKSKIFGDILDQIQILAHDTGTKKSGGFLRRLPCIGTNETSWFQCCLYVAHRTHGTFKTHWIWFTFDFRLWGFSIFWVVEIIYSHQSNFFHDLLKIQILKLRQVKNFHHVGFTEFVGEVRIWTKSFFIRLRTHRNKRVKTVNLHLVSWRLMGCRYRSTFVPVSHCHHFQMLESSHLTEHRTCLKTQKVDSNL